MRSELSKLTGEEIFREAVADSKRKVNRSSNLWNWGRRKDWGVTVAVEKSPEQTGIERWERQEKEQMVKRLLEAQKPKPQVKVLATVSQVEQLKQKFGR